jgi:hypothetical protein
MADNASEGDGWTCACGEAIPAEHVICESCFQEKPDVDLAAAVAASLAVANDEAAHAGQGVATDPL